MRRYLFGSLLASTLSLGLLSGCGHCCRRPACSDAPASPGSGAVPFLPPVPPAPPGAALQSPVPPPPAPVPGSPPPESSSFAPPSSPEPPTWGPSPQVEVRLGPPETGTGDPPADNPTPAVPRLRPPEVTEQVTPPPAPPNPKPPAVKEQKSFAPPGLPVGIPQFAEVGNQVASGLRPLLDDGLDWLQTNGYRTVLHLRRPGEEDGADRKQIEKRGLRYVSLEVSPQTLAQKVVDEFNRLVNDARARPLFVYDRDGALAGVLWYLHFRTAEGSTDETARVRASVLGLRQDREGLHRDMWQAAQQFLDQSGK
ncbi:MAG: hypothetical protein L0Z62_23520 [Gemmataceae bacterium]|nr:hypothetical protein [Gemmataceae bacterium]